MGAWMRAFDWSETPLGSPISARNQTRRRSWCVPRIARIKSLDQPRAIGWGTAVVYHRSSTPSTMLLGWRRIPTQRRPFRGRGLIARSSRRSRAAKGSQRLLFRLAAEGRGSVVSDLERFRGGTSLHNCLGQRITRINAKIEDRELQPIGAYLRISVSDTGCGIGVASSVDEFAYPRGGR